MLGLALGLFYGWVLAPVTYVDVSPAILRADYRTEYVLMVAEIYQQEQDAAAAAERLAALGPQPPEALAEAALLYAREHGHPTAETERLLALQRALSRWQAAEGK